MAVLKLYHSKLQHNYDHLNQVFKEHGIDWGVVTKLLCGHELYLKEVLELGVKEVHDSRVTNLKTIKKMAPGVQTVYIKPAPKQSIPDIIRYADVSFQTELDIIRLLSAEAVKQDKLHKIIIMIEMGDLREGVMGEELVDFYEKVFELPGISVIGLGANFNCLHGVMPTRDKLIQLSLYKQIIEAKFDRRIPWVSGGTSVTIPLLFNHQLPGGINHFRIGEALFFGLNLFTNETFEGMHDDVFELVTEII
ncbi:MAG: alanine racemase, partial [Pontibacter sp.]|nr:alanine racemase [Pontibacter sp.]